MDEGRFYYDDAIDDITAMTKHFKDRKFTGRLFYQSTCDDGNYSGYIEIVNNRLIIRKTSCEDIYVRDEHKHILARFAELLNSDKELTIHDILTFAHRCHIKK